MGICGQTGQSLDKEKRKCCLWAKEEKQVAVQRLEKL